MPTSKPPSVPALIAAGDAADVLGLGIKRFKTAVDEGQIGGCWLIEIGAETYVHRDRLDAFIAADAPPPAGGATLAADAPPTAGDAALAADEARE